jgi:branched-chain amino acid transport system substrate-binding protein
MASYCAKGGHVTQKSWVPLGTKDYSSVIAKIPQDVDAILVVLGGSDAVNFLTQYEQAGGNKPMVGGSITVDQTVLNYKGKAARIAARHAVRWSDGRFDRYGRLEEVRRRL